MPPTVLCYGDSNTHGADPVTGGRLPREVRWPGVLAAALAGEALVIEEGLSGRTTVWDDPFVEGRNGRTYLLPCLRSHQPLDVVVLMLGTNDLKSIFGRAPHEVAHGVAALADVVAGSGTGPGGAAPRLLLVSPPLLGEASAKGELWGLGAAAEASGRLAQHYRTVAEVKGAAFLAAGELVTADTGDGVHLAPAAHAILGEAIAAEVRRLLR